MTFNEVKNKYEPFGFTFRMDFKPGGTICVHVQYKDRYGRIESTMSNSFEQLADMCEIELSALQPKTIVTIKEANYTCQYHQ